MQVQILGNTGFQLTDVAVDAAGTVYGISTTDIYQLDLSSLKSNIIGSTGQQGSVGLTSFDTGTITTTLGQDYLYATSDSGEWGMYSPNGSTVSLGSFPNGWLSAGDNADLNSALGHALISSVYKGSCPHNIKPCTYGPTKTARL